MSCQAKPQEENFKSDWILRIPGAQGKASALLNTNRPWFYLNVCVQDGQKFWNGRLKAKQPAAVLPKTPILEALSSLPIVLYRIIPWGLENNNIYLYKEKVIVAIPLLVLALLPEKQIGQVFY